MSTLTSVRDLLDSKHLNFEVETRSLYTTSGEGLPTVRVPRKYAVVRTDTNQPLGVVGNRYTPVQNHQSFDFFDELVGSGEAEYSNAGQISNGSRIFIQAKLKSNTVLFRDDVVDHYLTLSNTHDGSSSLKVFFTPVRLVCANRIIFANKQASTSFSIRHTLNAKSKIENARVVLGLALDYSKEFDTYAEASTRIWLDDKARGQYIRESLDLDEKSEHDRNVFNKVEHLHRVGRGTNISGVRGSLWGAYNAVTEYVDHYQTLRRTTTKDEHTLFGRGASIKADAWTNLTALVNK